MIGCCLTPPTDWHSACCSQSSSAPDQTGCRCCQEGRWWLWGCCSLIGLSLYCFLCALVDFYWMESRTGWWRWCGLEWMVLDDWQRDLLKRATPGSVQLWNLVSLLWKKKRREDTFDWLRDNFIFSKFNPKTEKKYRQKNKIVIPTQKGAVEEQRKRMSPWFFPLEVFWGHRTYKEETPGKNQNSVKEQCILSGLGMTWETPEWARRGMSRFLSGPVTSSTQLDKWRSTATAMERKTMGDVKIHDNRKHFFCCWFSGLSSLNEKILRIVFVLQIRKVNFTFQGRRHSSWRRNRRGHLK